MFKKLQPTLSFLAAFTLAGAVFLPVLASPLQNPPNGNVDAQFSSVTASSVIAGAAALGNLTVNATGDMAKADNSALNVYNDTGFVVGNTAGTIKSFSVSGDGILSNPGSSNGGMIKMIEPQGFALAPDGTSPNSFNVSGYGNISNVSSLNGGRVAVTDVDGFIVNDVTGGGLTMDSNGNIANIGIGNSGKVVVNDDTDFAGHISASGGVGAFTTRTGTFSVPSGAGITYGKSIPCLANEVAVSCGYSMPSAEILDANFGIGEQSVTNNMCKVTAKNQTASAVIVTMSALCFDPNG